MKEYRIPVLMFLIFEADELFFIDPDQAGCSQVHPLREMRPELPERSTVIEAG